MTKLTISLVATLSLVAVAGCKKKGGDSLAKMEEFSKAMCECKDKACADKVNADMTTWGTEMAKTADKDAKPDPDMAKKSADIMTKYTECMTKVMMAGAGGAGGGAMAGGDKPATGDKPAAGGGGDCPAGTTKQETAFGSNLCFKAPDGFKKIEDKKMGETSQSIRFRKADKDQEFSFQVDQFSEGNHKMNLDSKDKYATDKKGQSGEIPNGKWWVYEEDGYTMVESMTKTSKVSVRCGVRAGKDDKDLIEVCKSLTAI